MYPSAPSDGAAAAAAAGGGGVVDNSSPVVEVGNGLTATTQTVYSENSTPVTVKVVKTAAGNRAKGSWVWQVIHEFKPSGNGKTLSARPAKRKLGKWRGQWRTRLLS